MTDIEIPVGKRTRQYRFFEILPGILSYSMILAPFLLALWNPLYAAVFIVLYIIMFFVKTLVMSARTIQGYKTLEVAQKLDWQKRLADLKYPEQALEHLTGKLNKVDLIHKQRLEQYVKTTDHVSPDELYNGVIIAMYNESIDILAPTVESVLASKYDPKHIFLTIAYEERGGEAAQEVVDELFKRYADKFGGFLAVKHPKDLPNEVIGKGGNITYAGRALQRFVEEKGIDTDNVLVTTLDSDNRPHKYYFSYVSYEYLLHPSPRTVAFQPLALFLNNIWDVPAPMRVIATGNSFWNLINSLRPHMLRNFASHSQSLAALIDMDFWSTRTIVEDGHQFWRSYFRFDGDYSVVPIYVPIYQDAVLSETYKKTLKAQFVQIRRWAYGASDVAYVASKLFRSDRTVPLSRGLPKFFRLLESHVSWASSSFIIAFGAFAPLLLNDESNRSIVAHQLPQTIGAVQTFAMIGLVISIFISFKLLPPRPARYKKHRNILMVLQWGLMPITALVYGASAALNSQTRLVFGKYLDSFDVTEKAVVKDDGSVSS